MTAIPLPAPWSLSLATRSAWHLVRKASRRAWPHIRRSAYPAAEITTLAVLLWLAFALPMQGFEIASWGQQHGLTERIAALRTDPTHFQRQE